MKGVFILACGHPYYGNYAAQLCRSIKAVDKDIKVAIGHCDNALSHLSSNPFDKTIEIPVYRTNGLPDYLKSKTYIYDLSPFDETIYLDADVIWLPQKPISELFSQFKDIQFTMSNRGVMPIGKALDGFIHWASPKSIMEEYNLPENAPLYNLASEFMYFKKNKEVKKMFNEAKKIYENPPKITKAFAGGIADELAFEIAIMKTKIYPHAAPFIPFYWEQFERKMMPVYDMYKQFYAYSLGGNVNTGQVANIYNNLANHYNKQFGINGYFPAKDKKSWLSNRQTL